MKLNLSIKDRLILPQLLTSSIPQGNRIKIMSVVHINDMIGITKDEIVKYGIKGGDDGSISWNDPSYSVEYDFTKPQEEILFEMAEYLDKNDKVTYESLSLIDRILTIKENKSLD